MSWLFNVPFEVFIPYNVPASKNNRVWTGTYFVVSAATKKWRKDTDEYWEKYSGAFSKKVEYLKRPYFIHLTFIRKTRHIFDLTNAGDTVMDAMVEHCWLNDDNADCVTPVYGKYEYDKDNPGVYIRLVKTPIYEFI